MKAWLSVILYRDDGDFSDYVAPRTELSCIPEIGDVINLGGMKLKAWSVGPTGKGPSETEWIVICRIKPGEVNRRTAQRKLAECGFRCNSRCRRRVS